MMNNELRPYENYKSIDLPWLCSIPTHWSISRNKNVMFQAKSLVGSNHSNYKLLSLTLNGVIARDMVNPKRKFPKEFDTYLIVNHKDLVFYFFYIALRVYFIFCRFFCAFGVYVNSYIVTIALRLQS